MKMNLERLKVMRDLLALWETFEDWIIQIAEDPDRRSFITFNIGDADDDGGGGATGSFDAPLVLPRDVALEMFREMATRYRVRLQAEEVEDL